MTTELETAPGTDDEELETPIETDLDDDSPYLEAEEGAEAEVITEPEPEPEPVDFAIDINGEPYPIPGVKYNEKQRQLLLADDKALQRLQTLARHGRGWEERGRDQVKRLERELRETKDEQKAEIAHAGVFAEEFGRMMDPNQTREQFIETALAIWGNWPMVQAKAETARAQNLLAKAQAPAPVNEPDGDELRDWARDAVSTKMLEALDGLPWATEAVRKELIGTVVSDRYLNQYVRQNDRGNWVIHWPTLAEFYEPLERSYIAAHDARGAAAKQVTELSTVAKTNAKRLATGSPPKAAPPAVAPKRRPATSPEDDEANARKARIRQAAREAMQE